MNLFDFIKQRKEQPEPLREIREVYRLVATGRATPLQCKQFITHLLSELHFFDEVIQGDEVVLANFARRFLYFLGVWDHKNLEDQSLIEAFLRIPEKDEAGNPVDRTVKGESLI